MTCISCGSDQHDWLRMPIDPIKNMPTPFGRVVQCKDCELGVAVPLPKPDEVPEFYRLDAYYTHGESHIAEVKSSLLDRILIKLAWLREEDLAFRPKTIAAMLPEGGSVCDLGCGHSEYLHEFKALGFDVLGVDPDPAARDYAAGRGVTVLAGTAEDLPKEAEGRQFDLVIMSHSLEHCLDPMAAVHNAFRLTKPGGLFYCEVPNCACDHFETFTVTSAMFDLPRHLYFFTPKSLRRMLSEAGFIETSWRWQGFLRNHQPSWRAWESTIAERTRAVDRSVPVRTHSTLRTILLLARTVFAGEARKYDSMGLLARRP